MHELGLKRRRMEFYRLLVDQGSAGYLILQLIEHPDDIQAVVSMLQAQHDAHFKKAQDVLTKLIKRELVHSADLDPVREHVVLRLLDALNNTGPERSAHDRPDVDLSDAETADADRHDSDAGADPEDQ
jgi:hypothetical protein